LEQKQKTELELIQRAEQLETRQTQDDAVLNVINRYWMQVDEDVGILLRRFGTAENPLDSERSELGQMRVLRLLQFVNFLLIILTSG